MFTTKKHNNVSFISKTQRTLDHVSANDYSQRLKPFAYPQNAKVAEIVKQAKYRAIFDK